VALPIDLHQVPQEPGVYQFKDAEGSVLYVGKAANLRARLASYEPWNLEPRKRRMLEQVATVELILAGSEKDALNLESNLIKRLKPRYNIRLTDDKRYPYIRVSRDKYPQVRITRNVDGRADYYGPFPDGGAAWETVKAIREVFKLRDCKELLDGGCLNYQMNLCWAPCIQDAEARLRAAPSLAIAQAVPDDAYAEAVQKAKAFLRGDSAALTRDLKREMERAAEEMAFERAAKLRDRLAAVEVTLEKQVIFSRSQEDRDVFVVVSEAGVAVGVVTLVRSGRVVGQEHYFFRRAQETPGALLAEFITRYYEHLPSVPPEIVVPEEVPGAGALAEHLAEKRGAKVSFHVPQRGDLLKVLELAEKNARFKLAQDRLKRGEVEGNQELEQLAKALHLIAPPRRIEGFDISHLGGTGVVASMVVLEHAQPNPSEYRRFKLSVDKNDDFAAMKEVVGRRYKRVLDEGLDLPDLVLIDGGKGQLSAAKEALEELGLDDLPIVSLAKREEEVWAPGLLRPLDIAFTSPALRPLMRLRDEAHRFAVTYQRKVREKRAKSFLDDVPGLGPAKKKALLAAFGSPDKVRDAPVSALVKVKGISEALAESIKRTAPSK